MLTVPREAIGTQSHVLSPILITYLFYFHSFHENRAKIMDFLLNKTVRDLSQFKDSRP